MSFRPKKGPKSGRRAQPNADEGNENELNINESIIDNSHINKSVPKQTIIKGWGDEASGNRRKSVRRESEQLVKAETILDKEDSGSDNEMNIPIIPEASSEDPQIAHAPNVIVNRVSTYKELDRDFSEHAAFTLFEGDVDLKIIAGCLLLKSEVEEEDQLWEYDQLFAEVTSDLLREKQI